MLVPWADAGGTAQDTWFVSMSMAMRIVMRTNAAHEEGTASWRFACAITDSIDDMRGDDTARIRERERRAGEIGTRLTLLRLDAQAKAEAWAVADAALARAEGEAFAEVPAGIGDWTKIAQNERGGSQGHGDGPDRQPAPSWARNNPGADGAASGENRHRRVLHQVKHPHRGVLHQMKHPLGGSCIR